MESTQNTQCGKMYTEHLVQTEEKISEPSWKNWQESGKTIFQSLDLRVNGARGGGQR